MFGVISGIYSLKKLFKNKILFSKYSFNCFKYSSPPSEYAAIVATKLKGLFLWTSRSFQNLSNFDFTSKLLKIIVALWSPARLKAFPVEVQVIVFCLISSEMLAIGMCLLSHNVRSAWISSEITGTLYFMHKFPIASSSSRVHTCPKGLWGLHTINNFGFSFNLFSKSSKSIEYSPFFSINLFSMTTLALSSLIS